MSSSKYLFFFALLSLAALFAGCNKGAADPAVVSQNRVNGKAIAQLNAAQYARENYPNRDTFVAGDLDSFVSTSCPQGDGYATWEVKDKTTGAIIMTLQCRTWEMTGCFPESEAMNKGNYMKNQCNPEVPSTIQKVQ